MRGLSIFLVVALALAGLTVLAGCDQDYEYEDQLADDEPDATELAAEDVEEPVDPAHPDLKEFEPIPGAENKVAVIETEKGQIVFEFFPDDAPQTVANFITLAKEGFYDGLAFHRVEPNFVVQGGCPYSETGDGVVGTGNPGYYIGAEFNERPHLKGTVAMARSQDPDSAGSQFYICLEEQPLLDGEYAVFGQVTEGMDVVEQITAGDTMRQVEVIDR